MSTEQQFHYLKITSGLGDDALIPEQVTITDKISDLYTIQLTFVANNYIDNIDDVIGEAITLSLAVSDSEGSSTRYFHGHINSIQEFGGILHNRDGLRYQATLAPRVWFATQRINSRIFQSMTVIDIVNTVLGTEHGAIISNKTQDNYSPYTYCVQYNESDWDFCQRLLSAEGIYFYFVHTDGSHEMLLADHAENYTTALQANVDYRAGSHSESRIFNWFTRTNTTVAATARRNFDFATPTAIIEAQSSLPVPGSQQLPREVFVYGGEDPLKAKTSTLNNLQLDNFTQNGRVYEGRSNCRSFSAGHRFTFADHQQEALIGQSFVITEITLMASLPSNLDSHNSHEPFYFENQFKAMPADITYRPLPKAKPIIAGIQTATVTGSNGEEIYTDVYGRVKVQFHWDRIGEYDENSSCWIRVAQSWAGNGFGCQFTPRVGHEVVVEFINGDPDQPVITGSVYNGENGLPFPHPENKTHSGVRSRSTLGGGETHYNEIRFIDDKGAEQFIVHAEKDQLLHIENDRTSNIDHNDTLTISNDQIIDTGNTISITAGSKITLTCGASSLTMDSGGNITLSGTSIKIDGSSLVDIDAASITLN